MKSRRKKGIVGIEAAIVLIAFVIVAASLAFVALNMGLFTTQKSKEVMQRGLEESTTALEVDGSVTALSDSGSNVSVLAIPIKTAPGRGQVDLATDKAVVSLIIPSEGYQDILAGVYYWNGTDLVDPVTGGIAGSTAHQVKNLSLTNITKALFGSNFTTGAPKAYVVFIRTVHNDTVLEFGEKAIVVVATTKDGALVSYDTFKVEIMPPEGSPLTVERTIPATLYAGVIDLG